MSLHRKIVAALSCTAAAAGVVAAAPAPAAHAAGTVAANVVLTIGADEARRHVTLIGSANTDDYVQVRRTDQGWDRATSVRPFAQGAADRRPNLAFNKAAINDLASGSRYEYRICAPRTGCAASYQFATSSRGNFNFLAFGDPQIYTGSYDGANPTQGWSDTVARSTSMFPGSAFTMTLGDQIDSTSAATQVREWDAFLAPQQLKQYALAPTLGNHDNSGGRVHQYGQNLTTPNPSRLGVTTLNSGDYSYTYNGVLFMVLNTNNRSLDQHKTFMQQTKAAHPDARWTIVSFHHAPYSATDHTNDGDVQALRTNLTPTISALGVDLVLGGHDHGYARTYLMNGTQAVRGTGGANVHAAPGQVLYVATNSSSDGKYYDLTVDEPGANYYWAAVTNQEYVPNFTNVTVSGDALNITTYRTNGSVVDQVALTKD